MKAKALKAFAYSLDGFTPIAVVCGDEPNIPDHLIPGLIAEGYVEAPDGQAAPEDEALQPEPEGAAEPAPEPAPAEVSDPYPHLSPAQEKALDGDGDGKPGGSRPRRTRKAKA